MTLLAALPEIFYTGLTTLDKAFFSFGKSLGDHDDLINDLLILLPNEIKMTPAFFHNLIKKWCYEYGDYFDRMPEDYILIGSEQFPEIEDFYLGIRAIKKHLTEPEILSFINRLKDPSKHLITLAELAPLVRIQDGVVPQYEIPRLGEGNRTIDWLFTPKSDTPILLDVKYRIKDLLEHMQQIIPSIHAGVNQIPPPINNSAILFKDTVEKFIARSPKEYLQGVWIHSHIKQDKVALWDYFKALDMNKLHFAIMSRWDGNAYVLYRDDINVKYIYDFFNLKHSETFVCAS